ncbi:MAG: CBS domain-containing protein [Brevundimonas sp.]|uniref:CBS domain-containing protein n=1 Tax=Brevundimonas sp. TaxID=1871086 RepID=UPI00391BBCAC
MKVRDIMSRDVQVARPGDSIQNVAGRMAAGDFGFMPVAEGDQLVGTVTDRDLVVRALAGGAGGETPVGDVMTSKVEWRRDDEDLKDVLKCMSDKQIRRLPILDNDDRLVGVVSLGDLSTRVKEKYAGEALEEISRSN